MKLTISNLKKMAIAGVAVVGLAAAGLSSNGSQVKGAALASGAETFKAKCAGCHGADGTGNTPAGKSLKVRDMHSADVQGQSDADILNIISNGKGKMPGYEKTLGADACKDLLQTVRSFK
jgi:cytochrome c6